MRVADLVNLNSDAKAVASQTLQRTFKKGWAEQDQSSTIHTVATIQEAIEMVEEVSEDIGETNVFVTGSIHLVGGVLSLLEGVATPIEAK